MEWGIAQVMPSDVHRTIGALWARVRACPPIRFIRSSLSLRSALVLSAAGIAFFLLFAAVVSAQMRAGVFDARRDQVLEDAAVRFSGAAAGFEQSTASTPDQVQETARQVVQSTKASAAGAGAVAVVLLRAPSEPGTLRINEIVDPRVDGVITQEIRDAIGHAGQAHWQSVEISGDENSAAPGILVGTQVRLPRAGMHQLFIVYSLAEEQEMVNMVLRILGISSVPVLLLLTAGVFWTLHHLTGPVRRTAAAARRLTEGDLAVRVPVEGVDEMSLLATSFNDMASSLQEQINEYDELSKLQQRFVSDVSHELRTPLTTIRMAEEMIHQDRDSLGPVARRSAELLHGQVERFDEMLSDLLEISRHDAQSALLDPERTDLRQLVCTVVENTEELAARVGVPVRVHLADHRCMAEIDPRRIERVLRNLVVNAIEHADGTPVDVHVDANESEVAVRVRDYGVGMSDEVAQRVFDRFYRADPARARTTGGTGLGLSIAHEDVTLHGGLLEVKGEPGRGASFLMTLPRVAGQEAIGRPLALWEEE